MTSLSSELDASVQQAEPQAGERRARSSSYISVADLSVGFSKRAGALAFSAGSSLPWVLPAFRFAARGGKVQFGLVVLCAFDDGIDDVRLPALGDLLADQLPDSSARSSEHLARDDGLAAGRQLVEHAEFEVAVEREGQRARDGRGGHHQHVRLACVGLLHQAEALEDAEAVLLVDDDEAEVVELDLLLDERVGADDEVALRRGRCGRGRALVGVVERAGEQGDAVVARRALEQLARGEVVLRGKDFRRRHQRGLIAVLDGDEHGLQRDDGLAGADVALQQAAHGLGLRMSATISPRAVFWALVGWKGRTSRMASRTLVVGLKGEAGALLQAAALQLQSAARGRRVLRR